MGEVTCTARILRGRSDVGLPVMPTSKGRSMVLAEAAGGIASSDPPILRQRKSGGFRGVNGPTAAGNVPIRYNRVPSRVAASGSQFKSGREL